MQYSDLVLFSIAYIFITACKETGGFLQEDFLGDEAFDVILERKAIEQGVRGPHIDAINLCKQQTLTQKKALDTQIAECNKKIQTINNAATESKKSCSKDINLDREKCNSKLLQINKTSTVANAIKDTPNSQSVDCNKTCKLPAKRLGKPLSSLLNISSGYYYVSKPSEKENWFMAEFKCRYHGFELASLETEAEHKELTKALGSDTAEFWISATDLGSEGRFYWAANGKSLTNYANFNLGQPDNRDGKEHCINLRRNQIESPAVYMWDDSRCDKRIRFICEVATTA